MTINEAVVALDVGGTSIKGIAYDLAGRVVARQEQRTPVADGPNAVVADIAETAAELARRAAADGCAVRGVGVVVPGVVDRVRGVVRYAANIGWRDAPLAADVGAAVGAAVSAPGSASDVIPVAVHHDVRAAGLAEATFGAGDGRHDVFFVSIGTGIAAAHVVGGDARDGSSGLAGEFGHIPVHPDGDTCTCGQRGCLEIYASAAGIARRYRDAGGAAASSEGGGGNGAEEFSARTILARLAGDPVAAEVWRDGVDALGAALATAVLLLDPAAIVIGGGLADAGEALLTPVREALAARLAWRPAPSVSRSTLGPDAGRLGAGILAWRAARRPDVVDRWHDLYRSGAAAAPSPVLAGSPTDDLPASI